MTRTGNVRWLAVASLALLVSVAGCGGGEGDGDTNRTAELEALRAARQELVQLRQEAVDLEARIEASESEESSGAEADADAAGQEGVEAAEAAPTVEELEAELATLEARLPQVTDDFGAAVVAFINADPPVEGEPLKPEIKEVMGLKIAEDMIVAREYIDQGGDYRRALDIYEQLTKLDPDNGELQAAIAEAEEMRYMTEERFALAKKGMTQDEVREVLGQVNVYNIKDYTDKGVVSWLYPREDKGAAGVYFNEKNGEWRVYQLDFDAVKVPEEAG